MQEPRQSTGKDVFEILVREHADMLMAFSRSLMHNATSAEDLFQQTMLVAWRRLDDYDRSRPFGPWLRGIAQNLALEAHRKNARAVRCADPQILAELDHRFESLAHTPGDSFRERAEKLTACLSLLPDHMREPLNLLYTRGMLISAIATALNSSEEAIKKRVQRARQLLADCILKREATP